MMAHAAEFVTLDEVNRLKNHSGCCRSASDNTDGRAALGISCLLYQALHVM